MTALLSLDSVLALGAVAAAAGFLLARVASGTAQPACHPAKAGAREEANVVVGAALARSLARAQAKKRSA